MGGIGNMDEEWQIFVGAGKADMDDGGGSEGRGWGIWHIF